MLEIHASLGPSQKILQKYNFQIQCWIYMPRWDLPGKCMKTKITNSMLGIHASLGPSRKMLRKWNFQIHYLIDIALLRPARKMHQEWTFKIHCRIPMPRLVLQGKCIKNEISKFIAGYPCLLRIFKDNASKMKFQNSLPDTHASLGPSRKMHQK